MSNSRRAVVLDASKHAYRLRTSVGLSLTEPINVYAVASKLELSVWFAEIGSMEGVYSPTSDSIVISSLRPRGRQAFTCAHEIAHHVFGDGDLFDELIEDRTDARRQDDVEFRANTFAGQLLMPKSAVLKAFGDRGSKPADANVELLYEIACWFGVGYSALVHHLNRGLNLVSDAQAEGLRAFKLPTIRQRILGRSCSSPLIVVDAGWSGRVVDAEVGDWLLLPPRLSTLGAQLQLIESRPNFTLACAAGVGSSSVVTENCPWSVDVRVCRTNYAGRAEYRFEPDEEGTQNGN